jgi:hypothetical protein
MVSMFRNGLLVLALLWTNSAFATLITFDNLTNIPYTNPDSNGEVDGTEWLASGLLLTSPTLALNVGCGLPVSCLGADDTAISDFNGTIHGSFVGLSAGVFSLGIEFCCEEFELPKGFDDRTITSIYSTSGTLLAQLFDASFFFKSAVPIGSFSVDFGTDAMLSLRFNEVPEPGPLALLLLSLLVVPTLARRARPTTT